MVRVSPLVEAVQKSHKAKVKGNEESEASALKDTMWGARVNEFTNEDFETAGLMPGGSDEILSIERLMQRCAKLARQPPHQTACGAPLNTFDFATEVSGGLHAIDESGEDFDILIAALVTTGVLSIFDGTDYTVFAPTDQAFYDLATAIRDDDIDDDMLPPVDTDSDALGIILGALAPEDIAAVLAYHVTEGVRNSRSVTRARQIEMLDGNTVSGRTMPGFIEANNSTAELENIDNRLADGMVHVIDAVLLP